MVFVGKTPKNISDSQYAHFVLEKAFSQFHSGQALPSLSRNAMGKPFLPPPWKEQFNLSHSKGFVAVAFGECPVGVDIQVHKTPSPSVVARVCSQEEQQWLQKEKGGFSSLWVWKEAYIKCRGEGIGTGRKLASLPLPLPQVGGISAPPYHFHLWQTADYSLGLCLLGEEATTITDLDNNAPAFQTQIP